MNKLKLKVGKLYKLKEKMNNSWFADEEERGELFSSTLNKELMSFLGAKKIVSPLLCKKIYKTKIYFLYGKNVIEYQIKYPQMIDPFLDDWEEV